MRGLVDTPPTSVYVRWRRQADVKRSPAGK